MAGERGEDGGVGAGGWVGEEVEGAERGWEEARVGVGGDEGVGCRQGGGEGAELGARRVEGGDGRGSGAGRGVGGGSEEVREGKGVERDGAAVAGCGRRSRARVVVLEHWGRARRRGAG